MEQKETATVKIKALAVRPDEKPEIIEIDDELKSYQDFVGGLIQVLYPWRDTAGIVCNDEGKINGLPLNRALIEGRRIYEIIAGDFLVVGLEDDGFTSLTDAQIKRYSKLFASPELFIRSGDEVIVFKRPARV